MSGYYDLVYRAVSPPLAMNKTVDVYQAGDITPELPEEQLVQEQRQQQCQKQEQEKPQLQAEQKGIDETYQGIEPDFNGGKQHATPKHEQQIAESKIICKYRIGATKNNRAIYLTVKTYHHQVYIDIREHFQIDNTCYPAKKGITLSLKDYRGLTMLYKNIEKGIQTGLRNRQ